MNFQAIINKYYPEDNALKHILITHSRAVALRALRAIAKHPELNIDATFVEEAAMLHDIGIFLCNAPSIECVGSEPYIAHGTLGANLIRKEGYEKHARVCERHTGAGITIEQIKERNLPLPEKDLLPETIEEQLVCYADKFFSKSHLDVEKTFEQAENSLQKFGDEGLERFRKWHKMFG